MGKKKATACGGLKFPGLKFPDVREQKLVAVPTSPFPRDQVADGGAV